MNNNETTHNMSVVDIVVYEGMITKWGNLEPIVDKELVRPATEEEIKLYLKTQKKHQK